VWRRAEAREPTRRESCRSAVLSIFVLPGSGMHQLMAGEHLESAAWQGAVFLRLDPFVAERLIIGQWALCSATEPDLGAARRAIAAGHRCGAGRGA